MSMDAQTPKSHWRTIGLVLFGLALLLVFWFGRASVNVDMDVAAGLMQSADPRLAWPVTVLIFLGASFLGVPQWALISGAVIAFGPLAGAVLSWVSSLVSSSANFLAGRMLGGERLRARLSERAGLWMDRLAKNGLSAALLVRLVPVAPYFVVNMAGGASTMRYRDFLIGTAIGILPKIAVIALFGKSLFEFLRGQDLILSILFFLLAVLLVILLWLWRRRRSKRIAEKAAKSETSS